MTLLGLIIDGGTLLYPFTFTMRDVLHKKAGASHTRFVILLTAGLNLLMFGFCWLVGVMPPDLSVGPQSEYLLVLAPGFRLVVDSDLNREFVEGNPDGLNTTSVMFYPYSHNQTTFGFPKCMIKHYKIEAQGEDGQWRVVYEDKENHQRFIKQPLEITARAVRFIPLSTYFSETKVEDYGSSVAHIFNFEVF